MGLRTFLSNLFFGTKEEQEIVRKSRQEEHRRDLERNQAETREDLRVDLIAGRQRILESLEIERRKREEREREVERRYREMGLRRAHRLPPKFKPK